MEATHGEAGQGSPAGRRPSPGSCGTASAWTPCPAGPPHPHRAGPRCEHLYQPGTLTTCSPIAGDAAAPGGAVLAADPAVRSPSRHSGRGGARLRHDASDAARHLGARGEVNGRARALASASAGLSQREVGASWDPRPLSCHGRAGSVATCVACAVPARPAAAAARTQTVCRCRACSTRQGGRGPLGPPLRDQTKMGPGSFAKGGTGSEPRDKGGPGACPLGAEVFPAAASHRGPEGCNRTVSTLRGIPPLRS